VVGIIRRNWRQYAGTIVLDSKEPNSSLGEGDGDSEDTVSSTPALFLPVDAKLPPVRISSRSLAPSPPFLSSPFRDRRIEELLGKRVLVAVDHWPAWSSLPFGHYVRILGVDGAKEIETQVSLPPRATDLTCHCSSRPSQVLLHEYGVPCDEFTTEVMACLPKSDWKITDDIIAQRTDLRHLPTVSIDPPGCKDIDDALHCRRLPNGNFEVGVHIADVSYFVKPDTPLDLEAAHRSTSTYLVERRLDMLPSLLTTEVPPTPSLPSSVLCSSLSLSTALLLAIV
jgi:exosome complex exonuclease DIS3/RRP44